MISWRNICASLGSMSWDDYLEDGVMRAIEVARAICAVPRVNALGFCVGGTLLACAAAVLRRKRRRPIASLTLLATMLDFTDSGDISVYVDDAYVAKIEQEFGSGGVFPGGQLAQAFASLRANDLVWQYVVNNYLKGRTPPAFDLLYWNSDSANLAGRMYAYYLRNMYLDNALRIPDRLTMCGVRVDLGRIELPAYVLATAEDHIVPWQTAFAGAQLLGKQVEFVLAASGHIAGVINPASKDRRSFRTGEGAPSLQQWLETSVEHAGSWWKHWTPWITARSGRELAARTQLGNSSYQQLEPAPGTYVRERR
jgi:polyhydroxyalkanoate synthase